MENYGLDGPAHASRGYVVPGTDAALVRAALAGDAQSLDALVAGYLPLVYNIVGRALDAPGEVDDTVQDVMLHMIRDLRQLREPEAFRSWLAAIAMRQVRARWRGRRAAPAPGVLHDEALADPGADFVDLTITALQLSGQRREIVEATRWLDDGDRQLLSLWWLEVAGQLTRAELTAAVGLPAAQVAVQVQRMKARLEVARAVVRAVRAQPACPDLGGVLGGWNGRPSGLWRKRIARHVRECGTCHRFADDLVPAEGLLAGIALVPVPASAAPRGVNPHPGAARAARGAGRAARPAARASGNVAAKVLLAAATAVLTVGAVGFVVTRGHHRDPAPTTVAAASPLVAPATSPPSPPPASPASPTASPSPSPAAAVPAIVNTALPVRAVFYYPWYPENFAGNGSHYLPSAGHYSVDDPATVDRQIKDMQYGGLQAGIVSWWGQGLREDKRMPLLMSRAAAQGFSWTVYYEQEAYGNPSVAQLTKDLLYLRKYSGQRAWLHIQGKPVIFVYADGSDACPMASRWAQANRTAGYYVVLKVFGGYRQCADQPQGWHQYADGLDVQQGYSAIASPGFWGNDKATPAVPRDPAKFRQDVTTVAASKAPFQLIISYNEWGEGTGIESTTAWASPSGHGVYVDILHEVFGAHPR
jgi:RNA polymerase sigma factor (sigma-70 family)